MVSQDSDTPCYYPEQLEAAGYVDKALAEYDRLAATPGLTCAADGYVSLSQSATQTAAATATALAATITPTSVFAAAQSLDDAGYETEAQEAAAAVIATHPGADVPPDLDRNGFKEFFTAVGKEILNPTGPLGWLVWGLIALGIIVGGNRFPKGKLGQFFKGRLGRSVDILPFAQGSASGDIGTTLADLIQHEYYKAQQQERPGSPKIVTETTPAYPAVDAALKVLPDSVQIFAGAWDAIKSFGVEDFVLSGTMITHPKRGAGVSITLHKSKKIEASEQLWFSRYFAQTPDKVEDGHYLDLAETVAIWLHEQLPTKAGAANPSATPPRLTPMWSRWQSYALFRNGVRQAQAGNAERALELYARSMADDPYFAPAMLNHAAASIEMIAGNTEIENPTALYEQHIDVLDTIQVEPGMPQKIRISALYNLGAAVEYSTPWSGKAPNYYRATRVVQKLDEIYREAGALDAQSQLMAVPIMPDQSVSNPSEVPTKRQDDLLRRFYPSVEMLKRIVDVRTDILNNDGQGVQDKVDTIMSDLSANKRIVLPDHRVQYGLACFYAAAYAFLKARNTATRCTDHLLKAIEGEPTFAAWATIDPSLAPVRDSDDWWNLFAAIVEEEPRPSEPPKPPTRTEHVVIFEEDSPVRLLPDALQRYIDGD